MNNFTNETINTTQLPRFEDVQLTPLHPSYWKVIVANLAFFFLVLGIGAGTAIYLIEDVRPYSITIGIIYIVLALLLFAVYRVSFKNRGYAFRTHDVIYRSGAISITTTIIPYNRVQHAALHEGWLERYFGLASVEVFTAGGLNSDIKIPGIEKEHAENIKQLLMGKIQIEVSHE